MGKRSDFKRRDKDFYPTPEIAVRPIFDFVRGQAFIEPCYGEGHLVRALEGVASCVSFSDAYAASESGVPRVDALNYPEFYARRTMADCFITNPPWPHSGGQPTIDIALRLSSILPTWLLLSADFAHNKYFSKLAARCAHIVSVGRVSWEQNGVSGKDNCAWYMFDVEHDGPTHFHGRS